MWAYYDAYLSAARDILGLELEEHKNYSFWEQASIHGGFRVMHEEFCLVCDFPEVLRVDNQNRPHCEDGPSHRWRDGWSLYHWHGTRVPDHWIESREDLTPEEVLRVDNVEKRAAGCAIIGWERMLDQLPHKIVDSELNPEHGELIEVQLPGTEEPELALKAWCPRNGWIFEGVPRINDVDGSQITTVRNAQAWSFQMTADEFDFPQTRT